MIRHIRSALWLLVLTLFICSVIYPVTLWTIGHLPFFHDRAQGSLIVDKNGKVIGSRLIAQKFTRDEFFQPRPSAADYNGMASSASNWGANNYKLRDRVCRQLGPIVRYGKGAEKFGKKPRGGVQDDIEAWFEKDRYQGRSGILAQWAKMRGPTSYAGLAEDWVKSAGEALKDQWKEGDKLKKPNEAFVLQWQVDFPEVFSAWTQSDDYKDWKNGNPREAAPANADLVMPFFENFAKRYPGEWPTVEDYETKEKKQRKRLTHVKKGSEIQGVFFDMWRQDHPDVPLEQVPGDMVTASASGLDPHITLDNAHYQKYRVAAKRASNLVEARAEPVLKAKGEGLTESQRKEILDQVRKSLETKLGGDLEEKLRGQIDALLETMKEAPFGGLVGVPLVNVLELNIALEHKMEALAVSLGN
jgi:K+-transporting ATPase ATPase C chain